MKNILVTILLAIVTTFITVQIIDKSHNVKSVSQETSYDRVIRTGTLRCGYWNWPPLISKDPKTGSMSGIFYDYVMELGKILNLKIDWAKETGFSDYALDLEFHRIDAQCSGVWPLAAKARAMAFSNPIYFLPLNLHVKNDDRRFDGDIYKLNDPQYTFAVMEGFIETDIVNETFPKAKKITLMPETNTASELFLNVTSGKADATVNDAFTAYNYMSHNPGQIRSITKDKPVAYFGNTLAVNSDEEKLLRLLNTGTDQLLQNGYIEKLIRKYEGERGTLLRVADHDKK